MKLNQFKYKPKLGKVVDPWRYHKEPFFVQVFGGDYDLFTVIGVQQ